MDLSPFFHPLRGFQGRNTIRNMCFKASFVLMEQLVDIPAILEINLGAMTILVIASGVLRLTRSCVQVQVVAECRLVNYTSRGHE